jgi:hypothetical protein
MGHLCSFGQKPHCVHKAELLPPFSKSHSSLILEKPLHRAFAGAASPAQLLQLLSIRRIGQQDFGYVARPWVGEVGKLQRNHLNSFELVSNQVDQVPLPYDTLFQSMKAARMEDEFP